MKKEKENKYAYINTKSFATENSNMPKQLEEEFELEERIKDWINFWFKEKYDAGGRGAITTSLLDFIKKEVKLK